MDYASTAKDDNNAESADTTEIPQLITHEVSRVIDINAHIINLEGRVDVFDGRPVALISFDNLGYGNISAIKLQAIGYNAFGDEVYVADKAQFILVIQDISVPVNGRANDLRISLPSQEIKRLELQESQVCYESGAIVSYEGPNHIEFIQQKLDDAAENKLHSALRERFDEAFRYLPLELDEGWICGCGRFNLNELQTCSCCNHEVNIPRHSRGL